MSLNLSSYIEKSIEIKSINELFDHYKNALNEFGYDHNVFIFFPPKIDARETIPTCPYFNVHEKIIDAYLSHKLYTVGPVFEKAKTTGLPVLWSDYLKDDKKLEKSEDLVRFIALIREHGYCDGLSIPVFGLGNSFGYFSFSKKGEKVEINEGDIKILHHVCMDLFMQYIHLTYKEEDITISLTAREKEVLSWVLQGKSNSVIAEIMDISEHTVTTYIRRSSSKLGASSKWSAAITAVLIGAVQY